MLEPLSGIETAHLRPVSRLTIRQKIDQYWNFTIPIRTDADIERDKWLIPGWHVAAFHRVALIPAAFFIQMCVGSVYAWSGFNTPIEKYIYNTNEDLNKAPITFYIAIACLGLAAAAGEPFLEKRGPRRCIQIGSTLFLAGNLLTALGIYLKQIGLVYFGYGVVGGMGLGISYISPVSPLQKWFPEQRGVAAGFAVCGFGGGAIIASYLQKVFMASLSLPLVFVTIGIVFFVIMMSFGIILRMPFPDFSVGGVIFDTIEGAESSDVHFTMSVSDAILSWEFWLLYLAFAGNELAGLLVISKIQTIITYQFGRTISDAVFANAVLSVFNLAGRMCISAASDRFGRKSMFLFMLTSQSIAVGLLPTFISSQDYIWFLAAVFCLAFMYGGGFGVIPAFLSDQFSSKNTGPTFGLLLSSWSFTTIIGAAVFILVFQQSSFALGPNSKHVYDANLSWILAVILAATIVCCFIRTDIRTRRLPMRPGEIFRLRLPGGQLVRLHKGSPIFRLISLNQEDAEWNEFLDQLKNRNVKKAINE